MATVTIPRAPRLPSDLSVLESADPVSHTLAYFASRRVARAKAAATECTTQLDAIDAIDA
jgi:hypothetical protein